MLIGAHERAGAHEKERERREHSANTSDGFEHPGAVLTYARFSTRV